MLGRPFFLVESDGPAYVRRIMPIDRCAIRHWSRGAALAASAAFVLLAASAGAQGSALGGVVRDSARGIGVAGADLRIEGTDFRALSDDQGRFRFADGTAVS